MNQKVFVVVARSRASAIVYPGEEFTANLVIADTPQPLIFRFAITYEDKGFDAALPVDFWVEVAGPAMDVHHAGEVFANAARLLTACVAVIANANMGSLEPHLVIDITEGATEHDFLQAYLPDQPIISVPARRIEGELVVEFLKFFYEPQHICGERYSKLLGSSRLCWNAL